MRLRTAAILLSISGPIIAPTVSCGSGGGSTTPTYPDADGDGWDSYDDCDDSNANVNPWADETCDNIDNDCDGVVDEGSAIDAGTWYADADSDGFGSASQAGTACSQPSGWVAENTDCDDSDASVHPGAAESCDSVDSDCDGSTTDSDAVGGWPYFPDADGDGFGSTSGAVVGCASPGAGYSLNSIDCNDSSNRVYPRAPELCDGADNDCSGGFSTSDEDGTVSLEANGTWRAIDQEMDVSANLWPATLTAETGTYWFCDGTYQVFTEIEGSNVTLAGRYDGATLDAAYYGRVLSAIDGATVDISDLTLTHGYVSGVGVSGGGVACVGSTMTIDNVTFDSNEVEDGDGGGLWAADCTVTVTDSTFTGNSAGWDGGAASAGASTFSFNNTTFTENVAARGSAVASYDGAVVTLASSTVSANTAIGTDGEASAVLSNSDSAPYGDVSLQSCTVTNNAITSANGGAAVVGKAVDLTISGGSWSGNSWGDVFDPFTGCDATGPTFNSTCF